MISGAIASFLSILQTLGDTNLMVKHLTWGMIRSGPGGIMNELTGIPKQFLFLCEAIKQPDE